MQCTRCSSNSAGLSRTDYCKYEGGDICCSPFISKQMDIEDKCRWWINIFFISLLYTVYILAYRNGWQINTNSHILYFLNILSNAKGCTSKFDLWPLIWPWHWPHIQNITSEMDSPSWKTLKKRYYTTLYVIEIKGWKFAEILHGRDRHLEFWEMLKVWTRCNQANFVLLTI